MPFLLFLVWHFPKPKFALWLNTALTYLLLEKSNKDIFAVLEEEEHLKERWQSICPAMKSKSENSLKEFLFRCDIRVTKT